MSTPPPAAVRNPWRAAVIGGAVGLVVGLLLGGLGTWAVITLTAHRAQSSTTVSAAAAAKATATYNKALFDCSLIDSPYLVIDARHGLMQLHTQSLDRTAPGLSLDSVACIADSIGAPGTTVSQLRQGVSQPTPHTDRFRGLRMVWADREDGGVDALVSPVPGA